jgi:hypothetical protein
MAVLDAGMFIILMATAFGSFFLTGIVKYGFVFKLVGAFLFFSLGVMMNAEYEVAYTVIVTDSDGNQSTDLRYLVGDGSGSNETASWLGWLFVGLGLIWAAFFFMEVMGSGNWSF